jgi:hypothetical protein
VKEKSWAKTNIDHFVLAKLEAKGMKPVAPADRRALIRRVTLDLTGLPPTPEEVDAFVNDKSPNAYEKVVDRLLASPRTASAGAVIGWMWRAMPKTTCAGWIPRIEATCRSRARTFIATG